MEFKGYGANASFDGESLHLTSKTTLTFGAKERHIPVNSITAISFKAANMLTNGSITVQVNEHKFHVHFLKKAQPDARALHDAVLVASGATPGLKPAGETPHDALDALSVRMRAKAEENNAKRDEQRLAQAQAKQVAEGEVAAAAMTVENPGAPPTDQQAGTRATDVVRAEAKAITSTTRAEAKAAAVVSRAEAKAARTQVKDDKRAAKTAATEAQEALIAAFSNGTLAKYVADYGIAEGLDSWAQVDRHLVVASGYASSGDIEAEERAIRAALEAAKLLGGRSMRKVTEKRLETTTGRLVRIGSSYLGIVEAEDPFSQHGRKGKLTAVVTSGEKRLEVRSDRIVGPRSAHAIDATTTAQVYLDGQSLVTQRPTLTRMVLLSPLPGSAIIPGMALQKKEKVDLRQAEFQVGGLGWSIRVVVHPDRLSGPRQLAEQINRHAKDMETKQATVVAMPPAPMAVVESNADNVLSRLERLQLLVSTGALTQDEADVLKRDILS